MEKKPVLFYSPYCKYSIKLWKKLKEKKLLDSVIKFNVSQNKNIPKYITSVPTLMVIGRQPIKGDAIEMYFNSLSHSNNNRTNLNKDTFVNSNNDNDKKEGINDYLPSEMNNNWSDGYSYIGSKKPINHRYAFLQTNNYGIPNKNLLETSNSKFVNKKDINKRLEEYKKSRF